MPHTPTPWESQEFRIVTAQNRTVCEVAHDKQGLRRGHEESIANTAFILRACNNFDALLAVCKRILSNCEKRKASRHEYADGKGTLSGCSMSLEDIEAARAAIAAAEGQP